jgi:hypothetical protein
MFMALSSLDDLVYMGVCTKSGFQSLNTSKGQFYESMELFHLRANDFGRYYEPREANCTTYLGAALSMW